MNFCFVVCHLCQHCLERYYHINSSKQQFSNEKQSKNNVQNYKHFSHFCTFLFLFLSTSYFKSYKHIKIFLFSRDPKALALLELQAKARSGQALGKCQTLAHSLQNPSHPPHPEKAQQNLDQALEREDQAAMKGRKARVPPPAAKEPPQLLPGAAQRGRRK